MTQTIEQAARIVTRAAIVVAVLAGVFCAAPASGQTLAVLPVNIYLTPDQLASTLTVANQGVNDTAVQVRVYTWSQVDGEDKLTPTDNVLVSPPIATIAPGGSQLIRIVLRKHPEDKEATYRIILDQIPPPSEPGVVHVVLKLSLPIFAQPTHPTSPRLRFHVERGPGKLFLVATNDGTRHEAVRDISLSTSDGRKLKLTSTLPYVLAGSTRSWEIALSDTPLPINQALTLTAHEDIGVVNQQVPLVDAP